MMPSSGVDLPRPKRRAADACRAAWLKQEDAAEAPAKQPKVARESTSATEHRAR